MAKTYTEWLAYSNKGIVVGFDVDGTLVTFDDRPKYEVINLYKHFEKLGCKMIVASGGGKDYAETWCNRLGLCPNFISSKYEMTVKPDIWFDDENVGIGFVNIKV